MKTSDLRSILFMEVPVMHDLAWYLCQTLFALLLNIY